MAASLPVHLELLLQHTGRRSCTAPDARTRHEDRAPVHRRSRTADSDAVVDAARTALRRPLRGIRRLEERHTLELRRKLGTPLLQSASTNWSRGKKRCQEGKERRCPREPLLSGTLGYSVKIHRLAKGYAIRTIPYSVQDTRRQRSADYDGYSHRYFIRWPAKQ